MRVGCRLAFTDWSMPGMCTLLFHPLTPVSARISLVPFGELERELMQPQGCPRGLVHCSHPSDVAPCSRSPSQASLTGISAFGLVLRQQTTPPKPSWSCKLNPLLKTLPLPSVISNSIQGHVILLPCDARSSYPVSWHIISPRLLSLSLPVK